MKFVETSVFTRRVTEALSDNEYRLLQEALLRRPAHGDLIEGTGGIRKLRWREEGRGKRGGLRIIYFWPRRARDVSDVVSIPQDRAEGAHGRPAEDAVKSRTRGDHMKQKDFE